MKSQPSYPLSRVRNYLTIGLAALATAAVSYGQTTTGSDASASANSNQGVTTLSPFEVTSSKDYGYLKTNSATATRIGMAIQDIPMAISVIGEEFMQDTNLQSLNDVYKYMASASGDSQFAMDRPSNNPTPQGNNTLRGFPVNIILRNGVFLYSTKNVADTIERIEVIKGPAAVFFGQGYPGGVINIITKQAQLHEVPTTLRYTFGSHNKNQMTLDTNQVLSKKAALRVVAGWENSKDSQVFEYTKRFDMDTSLVLVPFDSGKLKITAESSYLHEKYNDAGMFAWIFPSQYFQDYNAPSAALMAAAGVANANAYRARINQNLGAWIADVRKAAGDPSLPLYTSVKQGAYYTDSSGKYIHDTGFNFANRGTYRQNESATQYFTADLNPTDWLNVRYSYTLDNTHFDSQEGYWYPNADQLHFRLVGGTTAGYYRRTDTQQVDAVIHFKTGDLDHKILFGYLFDQYLQQYNAAANNTPLYWQVPGYNSPAYAAANPNRPIIPTGQNLGNVPVNQVVRDRYGNIKTPDQVYMEWDPGFEIQPPSNKVFPLDRNALDGYPNQDNAYYVNYQLTAFDNRLTVLAGYRHEAYRQAGQALTANFPWYAPPPYAFADTVKYDPNAYNFSPGYSGDPGNFANQSGNSWMVGASYKVAKDINVYATYSKTFHYNGGTQLGGYGAYTPSLSDLFQRTIDAYASIGKPTVYRFADGSTRTITTVDQARQAIIDAGADNRAVNEQGINQEIGVKTSLFDGKITSTVSLFRAERKNLKIEDGYHQSVDVFNFNYNPIINPITGANISPDSARHFRWYSNDSVQRTEGLEFETIWSPVRNFQSLINGSWMWTARVMSDPTINPNDVRYNIVFNSRIKSAPEFRFSTFNKYTFTDGPVRGLDVGVGMRYSSKTVISQVPDWNPLKGGLQGGDYVVFDAIIGYPYELLGYKLKSQLGVYNVFDEIYSDGWYVLAPPRTWTLSTTLSF